MKKLIVIFFIILIASAEWQRREEFTLPKTIFINDVKISINGSVWILTKSSISEIDFSKRVSPFFPK